MPVDTRLTGLEIAVVGMAGRFPSAGSVDALWKKLANGEECISFFTSEELIASGIDPAIVNDPSYVKAAGVVEGEDLFDAAFFNYSPREAALIDPQQRMFLEIAWAALEHAGYAPGTCRGTVGVYGGVGLSDYLRRHVGAGPGEGLEHQAAVANDKDFLTTRTSYKLNLEGPSLVVQTACSTSLVAIHLASQALIAGECDMALAGGVTIRLPQKVGYFFQAEGMSSPDGHCRAFSDKAQGCLPGNGGAIVVLKRLADALQDRDSIHAVIKGTAINNDGAMKVGFTAPRVAGQARVIRSALQIAEVDAGTIGYLEAHGTGTAIGDPIEIQAATQAFRQDTDRRQYCAVGTVKSNLGHMDAAAGVTGFIRAALAVKHGLIPPSLNCEPANPQIDFEASPFFVNAAPREWRVESGVRRAGVSSFGVGGTNAHAIVEEPPAVRPGTPRASELLVVSAKTPTALEQALSDLGSYLRAQPLASLSDVGFTLRNGRAAFRYRRAYVCGSVADAVAQLSERQQPAQSGAAPPPPGRLAFMFPGQGSQYPGMCRSLYEAEPSFRSDIDRAAAILKTLAGFDLRQVVLASDESSESAEFLRDTRIAQPAIFATSWALAQLLMRWGLKPAAMIGHSIGEYVAACLSGVLTFEDALWLVSERGKLMGEVAPGAMAAVPLSAGEIEPFLTPEVCVAVLNAPRVSVVAGPTDAVQALAETLRERGVDARQLHTSHAFHSPMMQPVLDSFLAAFDRVSLHPPSIPFVSNVTGTWITADEATAPEYWCRQLRQTVRFSEGLEALLSGGDTVLVEVGPGQSLTSLVRRHRSNGSAPLAVATTRHPEASQTDRSVLLGALGTIWTAGHDVNWRLVDAAVDARRVPLPTYPFQRERHWIESPRATTTTGLARREHLRDWFSVPTWERLPERRFTLPESPKADERWVVCADSYGLGAELGAKLTAAGLNVATVTIGSRFERMSGHVFAIDPRSEADHEQLAAALGAEGAGRINLVHCWAVEPEAAEPRADAVDRAFYSLLFLTRALAAQEWLTSCRLTIVSTGIHDVTGGERLQPANATALAFCRTLPLEHPEFECVSVDVALPAASPIHPRAIADQILALHDEPSGASIAIRGPHCWRQILTPVKIDAASTPPALLKEGGVYLITGGMRGVGLAVAEDLARSVHAKLVLVGRTPLQRDTVLNGRLADESIAGLAALERITDQGTGRSTISLQPGLEATLDALCSAYAMAFLRRAGVDPARETVIDRDELRARCRVLPRFDRLFARMLGALNEDGLVRFGGSNVQFTRAALESLDLPQVLGEAKVRYPRMTPLFELLNNCASQYHLALTGEIPALSLLFGEGHDAFERGVAVIRDHSDVGLCQTLVRDLLARIIAGNGSGQLRLLEVGGGEGLLTGDLLPLCENSNVEYHFTDISRAFVAAAERRHAGRRDFMRFGTLDIARAPEDQGFVEGTFDVVLAFNVLHATKSVAESLANAKKLLAPGGLLVLQESVRPARWVDFIWGLTDGWWAFEDEARRQSSPLLGLDAWTDALHDSGFEAIASFPSDEQLRASTDTGILVARKPALSDAPAAVAGKSSAVQDAGMTLAALENLRSLGAEVECVVADISDRRQAEIAIGRALSRFGRLDGVVHAALVLDDGTIQAKTRESVERVFAPKIAGTAVLAELLRGRDLDFFVMFSSLVSILGGAGQIDYCAASSFQDAFAHAENSTLAKSVISINWGAWREIGKAFRSAVERGVPAAEALPDGMSPSEGLDAFRRVLASPFRQVLVSPQDPAALLQARSAASRSAADQAPASRSSAASPTPAAAPAGPRNETERVIADIWRDVLGVDRVGVDDNFFDLGADSVISLQFIAKAKKAGLRFTNRQVFEQQTVAGLAAIALKTAAPLSPAGSES
jgi:acyl transferase domain-containing protein/SAM-dependent methyltransferase